MLIEKNRVVVVDTHFVKGTSIVLVIVSIWSLTGCVKEKRVDPVLLNLLMSVQQSEYHEGRIQGSIKIERQSVIPEFITERISSLGDSKGDLTVDFSLNKQSNIDLTIHCGTILVHHAVCSSMTMQLDNGNVVPLVHEFESEHEGAGGVTLGQTSEERTILWAYFIVLDHLFPLSNNPLPNAPLLRYKLTHGSLKRCNEQSRAAHSSLCLDSLKERGAEIICAEGNPTNSVFWKWCIAKTDVPYLLRKQTSVDENIIEDRIYSYPKRVLLKGRVYIIMGELIQIVPSGELKTVLTQLKVSESD